MSDDNRRLHNVEAEQAVLGGLMMAKGQFLPIATIIGPEDFHDPLNRRIAEVMWARLQAGESATPITLKSYLDYDAVVVAGVTLGTYVARLATEAVLTLDGLKELAKIIGDLAIRRRMVEELQNSIAVIRQSDLTVTTGDLLVDVETRMYEVREARKEMSLRYLHEAATEAVKATIEAKDGLGPEGYSTGLTILDQMIGPMRPGDVISICAPSGSGKTALATQIMMHNALGGDLLKPPMPSCMYQLEMGSREIAQRVMATYGAPPVRMQRSGRINEGQMDSLIEQAEALQRAPVLIDDGGRKTWSAIASSIRYVSARFGVGLVVIDNLQLIEGEDPRMKNMEVISRCCTRIKGVAKECGVVLVMLSQLTRESQKDQKSWRFSDQAVFGGDALKQASDVMLGVANPIDFFIAREPAFEQRGVEASTNIKTNIEMWRGYAEIGGLKMRHGEKGKWFKLRFNGERSLFSDAD